jgi:16S rRNA (adenine1518-N6/adenine1519-N6)-dimethyltransferase
MEHSQNLSAKKSLGQNFLKSLSALRAMVGAAHIDTTDIIVEIGPGKGALTQHLLETGARVIAYELDPRMVAYLSERFSDALASGQLTLVHKDILEVDIHDELGIYTSYKVIANIPYYITNALLRKFLSHTHQPSDMVLLVQKEVAERIVVRDGKHSLLSLSVSLYGTAKYIMKVHKKYFSPVPKIDSAIIHIGNISRIHMHNESDEVLFFDMLHAGFGQKRKMLLNNLSVFDTTHDKEFWRALFRSLHISEKIRAEEVDIALWLDILKAYKKTI